ncbi:cytochrome d ubiquinol oxidase subunit II [Nonomuraea africana]|uniref:cytochrome d ubiquinol oxidase subunit II n=1 Tax=Nonomuraea africana TaxID=46171 RepID=UPI0033D0159F
MEVVWLLAFAVLLTGYFALEGFDLGVGLLMAGRSQERRDRMVAAMAPFVLANEVWLVAVAGVLFGAFPVLEGEVIFALYPLVVAMLLGWIVRDAGLWFRRRMDGRAWRGFWDLMISLGSLVLAVGWGMVIGSVAGLPWIAGLALGAVTTALFAFHGRTFLAWREAHGEGRNLTLSALAAAAPVIVLLAAVAPHLLDHAAPAATLNVLSLMVVPFAPLMVGAQVWVWRTFRPGKGADRIPSFF